MFDNIVCNKVRSHLMFSYIVTGLMFGGFVCNKAIHYVEHMVYCSLASMHIQHLNPRNSTLFLVCIIDILPFTFVTYMLEFEIYRYISIHIYIRMRVHIYSTC